MLIFSCALRLPVPRNLADVLLRCCLLLRTGLASAQFKDLMLRTSQTPLLSVDEHAELRDSCVRLLCILTCTLEFAERLLG